MTRSALTRKFAKPYAQEKKEAYKLSKFDLQRLLDNQRRYDTNSMNSTEMELLEELTPIESQSTRIWNDKGYLKDQALYDENRLHGQVGSYQFTNQQ